MAISLGAAGSAVGNGTTASLSFTNNGDAMVVGLGINASSDTTTAFTYNGTTLVKAATAGADSNRGALFYILNPTNDGSPHTLSISISSTEWVLGVQAFSGVDLTMALSDFNATSATGSASPATVTVTSNAATDVIVDIAALKSGGALTVGAGQTSFFNTNSSGKITTGGSTEPGTGSNVVMSWTSTTAWAIMALRLKEASAAGLAIPVLTRQYRTRWS